ncbi:S8 family serine peptidase [Archangium gephyra]|uniref:cyanobactin maturation protease PatG family protein n=1 Tax=Archangium gephyra TaxID=48 RepID=UPI0035D42EC0
MLPGLAELWAETLGDPRVTVAVLDGPVDLSHPCFEGADLTVLPTLVPAVAGDAAATEHGTFVASLLFGRHQSPVAGVAPECRGLIAPIFGDGGGGAVKAATQTDLARAITQAVTSGAKIINLSGGELAWSAEMAWPLADAVKLCEAEGALLVAAAGNDGCRCVHVPAAAKSVLVVGAMDARGAPLPFSNHGEDYHDHGILAPGEDIEGAVPGGGTARRRGTSYAAPIVSGVVALLLSREMRRGRGTSPREIFEALLESAITCEAQPADECDRLFRGRLDVTGAIRWLDAKAGQTMTATEQTVEAAGISASSGPAPQRPRAGASAAHRGVHPADCGCGCGGGQSPLVFAIGTLGFDFGTEGVRDIFNQSSPNWLLDGLNLKAYLTQNPTDAASIVWTLSIESYPVYAIRPSGPFAEQIYETLVEFIGDADHRVSVPARKTGAVVELISGQVLPVIEPELAGLNSWTTAALVESLRTSPPEPPGPLGVNHRIVEAELANYLDRVYFEMRNVGEAPQHRALNFSATNAYETYRVFFEATRLGMKLERVDVERSPLCRPESDCWDVKLTFFDPLARRRRARQIFRFTVDVSDVEPVLIGNTRSWQVR